MDIEDFKQVCEKLGMNKYSDYNDEDYFWEALASESKIAHYTFNGYDFYVAKFSRNMAYVWHNGLYKPIGQQTPEMLEEQIKLFHKNYKEYSIQNKIKEIKKDFKDEDNFFAIINE